MLLRKLQEPIAPASRASQQAEDALFLRLEEHGRNKPFMLDCSVQQLADDEFVAVLSDHESGAEVCAWSGAADGVVVEFQAWLDKRFPPSSAARASR